MLGLFVTKVSHTLIHLHLLGQDKCYILLKNESSMELDYQ